MGSLLVFGGKVTKFEGKVALVTGAASGVGRATSRQMVDEGAKVFGIDINKEGLESCCR